MLPLRSSTIPIETGASSSLNERICCRTPSSVSVNASLANPLTTAPRRSTTATGTKTSVASARKAGAWDAGSLCAAADQAAAARTIVTAKAPPALSDLILYDCMRHLLLLTYA